VMLEIQLMICCTVKCKICSSFSNGICSLHSLLFEILCSALLINFSRLVSSPHYVQIVKISYVSLGSV